MSLHAFRLVIEQLSQFYNTSAKVTAETIQYTPDSTYKAVQEEWTRIEGMIQSKLERIIQETHAAGEAAQEMSILAESTEDQCSTARGWAFGSTGQSDDQYAERYDTELEG